VLMRRTSEQSECWHDTVPSTHAWAAVADGMGGHEAGNIASDLTIATLVEGLPLVSSEQEIADLSLTANGRIFEAMHSGDGRPRMGSTVVAATIRQNYALILNVGDSRAYRVSHGRLHRLSVDHALQATGSNRRQHALTQSLGGLSFQVPIIPHVVRVPFGTSDALLLCSDGLTDMIDEAEIEELLAQRPAEPAMALMQAALAAGGRDNVTVVLIGPADAEADAREDPLALRPRH